MTNWLAKLDPDILATIKEIGSIADERGLPAYVVGGFVRDIFLKRRNLDLDVVVEGDALSFAQNLSSVENASLIMHRQFGTATLILPNNLKIDVATARKEKYPASGALPVVEPGSLKDDLFRRDFTINAMAIGINRQDFGHLRDDFNGLADLKKKKVRVLHKLSFMDDPTRILRAVRFEQRFQFHMEAKTLELLRAALKKKAYNAVKSERYFNEFKKILNEARPKSPISRLVQLDGLKFLGVDLKWDAKMLKSFAAIERNLAFWHEKLSNKGPLDNGLLYFMALTQRTTPHKLKEVLARFNLSKADRRKILESHELVKQSPHLKPKTLRPSQVFRLLRPFSYEATLFVRAALTEKISHQRIDNFLLKYDSIKLAVDGHDLMALGVLSDKSMGQLLDDLLDRKIDGQIRTREEELKAAEQLTK